MKTKSIFKWASFSLAVMMLILVLPACGSDDEDSSDDTVTDGDMTDDDDDDDMSDGDMTDDDDDDDVDGDGSVAYVRVIHLSPDAPAVDVFINGALSDVQDLSFGDSTGFVEVPVGEYDFAVAAADDTIENAVLAVDDVMLEADMYYTVAAYGQLSSISAMLLMDDAETPASGNLAVRAIHAADGVGQVDIWNIPGTGDPAEIYSDVDYGVAGDFLELPAGAYTLGLDADNDMVPDFIFQLPSLSDGSIANVFAVLTTDGPVLIAQLWDGTTAQVEVMEDL